MRFRLALTLLLLSVPAYAADKPFFFQKGDRIVFLGDSITEQYQYSNYLELYLTTRFPDWDLTFLNAGIGGDTANGGAGRFKEHVLDEKPTAVTIDFGMNDGAYGRFDAGRNKQFVEKTNAMLDMAKKAGVRVALISPNAVDRRGRANFKVYMETQKEFYAPLAEIAAKHHVPFVDQYAITRAVQEKLEADKADKVVPFPDGVHTGASGGLLMAHTILVGLGAPAKVSDAVVERKPGGQGGTATFVGCKIDNLAITGSAVAFDRVDDALPLPVLKEWLSILPYVDNLKDLNYYGVGVTGLPEGNYTISIDGVEVAKASADQLAKGVNVGNVMKGPIYDQSRKVMDAINAKNQLVHARFRGVVMFNPPDWLADVTKERKPMELSKRKAQIDAKQAEIYKMVKPVKHKFTIKAS